jgi:plasmid stabilization system protein ParE
LEIIFHPLVKRDVIGALKYYNEISGALANEWQEEVRLTITQLSANPLRFHLVEQGFRRANLQRFPYHVLYEIRAQSVWIMHIRHNKRHPDYGMTRQ